MQTHFTDFDLCFFLTGFLLLLASVFAFVREKHRLALFLLVLAAFSFRLLMAFIDPFLNLWDEQFHAMVARTMIDHPFVPVLYENAVMPYKAGYWDICHIWVHKPPLFLWQMALVMKIAGPSVWAVRLPSVILTTLMIPSVYRMGELLSGKKMAYYAAFLLCMSNLQVNIVSGFLNTDHNDVIFLCFVTFSFRAWMESCSSGKRKWIFLTGLFAGMAILVKFLPGLLVFGAWGISILASGEKRYTFKSWLPLLKAFLISVFVAAPWFIYIFIRWPEDARASLDLQSQHFTETQGHDGPWYFHFQQFFHDYGWWFVVLLPFAFFFFLRKKDQRAIRFGIVGAIVFVYVFYSFVKTRMPLFCVIVSPLIFLITAELFRIIHEKLKGRAAKPVLLITLPVLAFFFLDIGRLEHYHTNRDPNNPYRPARIHNRAQFEKAAALLPSKDYVLFNCGAYSNGVACMFYTGVTSYSYLPDADLYHQLKAKHVKMAAFDDIPLPDYMAADPDLFRIHLQLIRNGF